MNQTLSPPAPGWLHTDLSPWACGYPGCKAWGSNFLHTDGTWRGYPDETAQEPIRRCHYHGPFRGAV